jgi:hypothetical protein
MEDDRTFYVGYGECGCAIAVTVASGGRFKSARRHLAQTIAEMVIHSYIIKHEAKIPDNFLTEVCTHRAKGERVEGEPVEAFKCGGCGNVYGDEAEAVYCCAPDVEDGYKCGACGVFYPGRSGDNARACCVKAPTATPDAEPSCDKCGAVLTDEDVRDSKHIGTLARCRSCILFVAPEMLTADQIAYGRAA